MDLHLHDKVELKKAHPCGSTQWEILRVGMDIKLKCLGCGHELMLPRSKAEKSIRKILTEEVNKLSLTHISVNGHITYNVPSPYDGFLFRDVYLEFKDGKIVKATSNNTDYMNEILDIDEGARYIGEFAFGVNPEINHPIGDILFDEKIAGSFHLTPGNSYDNASNGNHSAVHWDPVSYTHLDVYKRQGRGHE